MVQNQLKAIVLKSWIIFTDFYLLILSESKIKLIKSTEIICLGFDESYIYN